MKKLIIASSILLLISLVVFGQGKKPAEVKDTKGINWITFEEAEQKMKEQPKKVLIDVYTDWCGWCKVLDKKTYSNPQLIEYVNKNFYAIKFNAEQKEPVQFLGKKWEFVAAQKSNALAVNLMGGRMSYPTTVFMEEGFKEAQPIPGFMEVYQMEGIMKFIGDNFNKKMNWNDFQHQFKPEWKPQ